MIEIAIGVHIGIGVLFVIGAFMVSDGPRPHPVGVILAGLFWPAIVLSIILRRRA